MEKPPNVFMMPSLGSPGDPDDPDFDFDDGFDDEIDDYDAEAEAIRARNVPYLTQFEQWLTESGLKKKTIDDHVANVDFYLNTYLVRYDVQDIEDGCNYVSGFLGDFFIRKCMWSSPASIKSNAASFKKFYKCMLDAGHIKQESYDALLATIKDELPSWQEECRRFDEGLSDPFFDALYDDEADFPFGSLGLQGGLAGEGVGPGSFGRLSADELLQLILSQADSAPGSHMTRDEAIQSLLLMVFYLTSWREKDFVDEDGHPVYSDHAWKSADWAALDALRDADFVRCSNKAKSLTITEEGMARAERLLESFGFDHLL